MKDKTKKIMAVLLAGFLLCTGMNLPANAEEGEMTETVITEEEPPVNPEDDPPESVIAEEEMNPDFVCWWVYGIYGLWVEEEPKEDKYWLCARIGDCCD